MLISAVKVMSNYRQSDRHQFMIWLYEVILDVSCGLI